MALEPKTLFFFCFGKLVWSLCTSNTGLQKQTYVHPPCSGDIPVYMQPAHDGLVYVNVHITSEAATVS